MECADPHHAETSGYRELADVPTGDSESVSHVTTNAMIVSSGEQCLLSKPQWSLPVAITVLEDVGSRRCWKSFFINRMESMSELRVLSCLGISEKILRN